MLAPTIGYGTPHNERDSNAPFTHLKKLDGNDVGDMPNDECDYFCQLCSVVIDSYEQRNDKYFSCAGFIANEKITIIFNGSEKY